MLACIRPSSLSRRSLDWDCYQLGWPRRMGHFLTLLFIVELWSVAIRLPTDDQRNARSKVWGSQEWIDINPPTPLPAASWCSLASQQHHFLQLPAERIPCYLVLRYPPFLPGLPTSLLPTSSSSSFVPSSPSPLPPPLPLPPSSFLSFEYELAVP